MRRLARPLMYLGVFVVVFGLGEYHGRNVGGYDFVDTFRFGWALAYSGLLCVAAYALGLPEVPRHLRARIITSFGAASVAALGVSAVQLLVGDALLPRFVVFGAAVLLVPWFSVSAHLARAGRSSAEARDRVIVVGTDALASELARELVGDPERPASIVAQLSVEDASDLADRRRPLVEIVTESRATVVVLSGPAQADERIVDQAALLHEAGVRVRTRLLFSEEYLGKIPISELGRVSLFFDIGEVHRDRYGRAKRIVDLGAGAIGLVVLAAVIPFVLIGNAIGNRGPLLYSQARVGRGGAIFTIHKLRSMIDAPEAPTDWTGEDDPRITPFGRVLRRTHLDELPQAWNMVRGDLSFVGPRPEQPRYVGELVQKLPYYDLRHIVRPGLTGWAQVKYGYASDEEDALEKLQYDFHYLRRQSLAFDLRIVGRTVRSVLGGSGSGR